MLTCKTVLQVDISTHCRSPVNQCVPGAPKRMPFGGFKVLKHLQKASDLGVPSERPRKPSACPGGHGGAVGQPKSAKVGMVSTFNDRLLFFFAVWVISSKSVIFCFFLLLSSNCQVVYDFDCVRFSWCLYFLSYFAIKSNDVG